MSTSPESANASEIDKVLRRQGWEKQKSKSGSHRSYKKAGEVYRVVVPDHGGQLLAVGTFHSVLKQAGLRREEFFRILSER
jgi:predicted RNA binding protein YcfA (HicA-like mRNA interferase family)